MSGQASNAPSESMPAWWREDQSPGVGHRKEIVSAAKQRVQSALQNAEARLEARSKRYQAQHSNS